MRKIAPNVLRQIAIRDDDWVEKARNLVADLANQDKERQLRNIQSIAEGSSSWKALELFIRYQAAGKVHYSAVERLPGQSKQRLSFLGVNAPHIQQTAI